GRRAAQDVVALRVLQAVGPVRGTARKLRHLGLALKLGQHLLQPGIDGRGVELLARAHLSAPVLHGAQAFAHRATPYFINSSRAIMPLCTSSGPSAKRRLRA